MPEVVTIGETMAVMVPAEAGPLRYVRDYRMKFAGAESNTAIGLCKLGHTAGWISSLGQDELGEYICNAIRSEGVDVSQVDFQEAYPTGMMLKQFHAGQTSVFYYRAGSAASHMTAEQVPWEYLKTALVIHMTGITPVLSESCREMIDQIFAFAQEQQIAVSFDPNIRRRLWKDRDYVPYIRSLVQKASIVLLGKEEGKILYQTDDAEALTEILRAEGVKKIAIKDGENGAWAADSGQISYIPPQLCRCIDPVGAGDAFNAAFLAGILEKKDITECGIMGAIAGACATETSGDIEGLPSARQLLCRLRQQEEILR